MTESTQVSAGPATDAPVINGVDPRVKLPRAVVEQQRRADALQQSLRGNAAQGGAPLETPQANTPAAHQSDWERNFNSMKGRFESTQKQLSLASAQIAEANRRSAELQAQLEARQAAPAAEQRFVTDKDLEDFGPEFADFVRRAAQETVAPQLTKLQAENARLQQQVGSFAQGQVAAEQQNVRSFLEQNLPDWQEQNNNPLFLAWLQLTDPFSGRIRQDMLSEAFAQRNAPRVLSFFTAYRSDAATSAPARNQNPAARAQAPAKLDLSSLAVPGGATSAAASAPVADQPIFTKAQFKAFYEDVRHGRYRGQDAKKDAIERQLHAAMNSGRVQG